MLFFHLARKHFRKLKHMWAKMKVRKVVLALAIYSFGGAAAFQLIENQLPVFLHERNPSGEQVDGSCLAGKSYWAALQYVNTLYSLIGYGSLHCCTNLGRFLTCVYIFFGTPMLFIVLEAFGKIFALIGSKSWTSFKRYFYDFKQRLKDIFPVKLLKTEIQQKPENLQENSPASLERDSEEIMPLTVGLILSALWLLGAAVYFQYIEGWPYGQCVYFLWISVTTVGLGDLAPTRHEFTILNFILIFIGIALVSMCFALLQHKIERIIRERQADMQKRKNSQAWGLMFGKDFATKVGDMVAAEEVNNEPQSTTKKFANKIGRFLDIRNVVNEENLLRLVMTSGQVEELDNALTEPPENKYIQTKQSSFDDIYLKFACVSQELERLKQDYLKLVEISTAEQNKTQKQLKSAYAQASAAPVVETIKIAEQVASEPKVSVDESEEQGMSPFAVFSQRRGSREPIMKPIWRYSFHSEI